MGMQAQIDGGAIREVQLTRKQGRQPSLLRIDGRSHDVSLHAVGGASSVRVDGLTERVWIAVDRDAVFVHAFGQAWRVEVADSAERGTAGAEEADVYAAPMPGTVVTTTVTSGQAVVAGEPLLVIESMKMQSEIVAWRDGVVHRTRVDVGDTFDRGAVLVELEPIGVDGDDAA
jgi:acetyl/propionyl-CoA carboxylase alpha subunit